MDPFQEGLHALQQSRLEVALEKLTEAERSRPNDPRVHNFRGIVLARLGQDSEAIAEYRETIRLNPHSADAYRNLGYLEWVSHDYDSARAALERARQLAPDDTFVHYYLGRVALDQKQYVEAFRELDRPHGVWPDEPEFLAEAATGYVVLGRNNDARKTLLRMESLPLNDAESVRCGALLFSAHDTERAVHLFRKLRAVHGSSGDVWAEYDAGLADLLAGHFQEAVSEVQPLIKERPGADSTGTVPSVAAWSILGIAYARLGQADPSIAAFRQAASLAPNSEERWLDLTRELMEVNRFAEAISASQEGLASLPRSYALHLRLGAAYLAAGRYREAESVFRDLMEKGDPLPTSTIGLAQALLRTGRAAEAARELSAARERLGTNFLIVYFEGLALDRAGQPQEAIAAFEAAVRLDPASAEAYLGLGKVELRMRQARAAIDSLKTALELDAGNAQARRLLSQAYAMERNPEEAIRYAQNIEANALPKTEAGGPGDFFVPNWQEPPGQNQKPGVRN